jgi:hypothetical protein
MIGIYIIKNILFYNFMICFIKIDVSSNHIIRYTNKIIQNYLSILIKLKG